MTKTDREELRKLFLHFLTVDSECKDARRKDFNQAIFNAQEGWACFNDTDLDMVMEKFDKAVRALSRIVKMLDKSADNEQTEKEWHDEMMGEIQRHGGGG